MNQLYDLKRELILLDAKRIRLYIDEFEDLTLELDGKCYKPVTAIKAFPVTAGDQFIVLRNEEKEEIGAIQDVSALNPESRRALRTELDRLYFTTFITQINAIEEEFHIPKWDVDTNRGPRVFEMASTRRDMRILENGRILMRDADGNRYEIPDHRKMDEISQAILETLL
ncbi:MAG: DUF1854 domain-containing protein [Candidatus Latescibacteria bacterium]|jgi:hypothetical protein|nr:DUF1854 domain-containing protein [Candidatus Latescibacterota bacterium]